MVQSILQTGRKMDSLTKTVRDTVQTNEEQGE